MEYLGVRYEAKHLPELDPQFVPFGVWMNAYRVGAEMPLAIAVERDQGHISVHRTKIHGTPQMAQADYRYVERFVKFLLWSVGGLSLTSWVQPARSRRNRGRTHSMCHWRNRKKVCAIVRSSLYHKRRKGTTK